MIYTWVSWPQKGQVNRNVRVASVNSTSADWTQAGLVQFTFSLKRVILFLVFIFSPPGLDESRPDDPQGHGGNPPHDGIMEELLF
jgi:hypothetical protein